MIRTDQVVSLTDLPIAAWDNIVTVSTISADTEDPDFPITNVANPSTSLKWKQDFTDSPATTDATITINAIGQGSVNYVAIAGHNLGSAGISIAISAAVFDSPQSDIIEEFTPTDDSPIILVFSPLTIETAGSIKIRLQTASVAAEIAVIYCGTYTVFEEGIEPGHTPLPLASSPIAISGESEDGSFLGRVIVGSQARSTATISNLSKAWVRSDLMPFLDFAEEFPFFWAWSPDTYPDETAFAWLENDPQPVFDVDGYCSVQLDMAGIVA